MSIETEKWPSKQLKNTLTEIGTSKQLKYAIDLQEGAIDITTDEAVRRQIKEFHPDVKLIGFELKAERSGKGWGGTLARVTRNSTDDRRCLQYVHVWTRQRWFTSFYWNVLPPIFLAVWGVFVLSILSTEDDIVMAGSALFAVGLAFVVAGILPHLKDIMNRPEGHLLSFRSTTLLILFGILEWLMIFEVWLRNRQKVAGLDVQEELLEGSKIAEHSLIVPTTSVVLLLMGLGLLLIWLFQPNVKFLESAHAMDYAPVFVWLKRDGDAWKFDRACWDYFHYYSLVHDFADLKSKGYLKKNKQVRLQISNTWHSFSLGKSSRILPLLGLLLFIASLLGFLLLLTSEEYESSELMTALTFIALPLVMVIAAILFARTPFDLLKKQDLNRPEHHFSKGKLQVLWNLREDHAGFKIRTKMQEPFNEMEGFFHTFRDVPEDMIYEILERVEQLEMRLKKAGIA
ncbi:MAG: hypothetical protein ACXAB4_03070 [Candidatus Hodarchaeales archaeon]|jgi:ABC-type nickel/cobalt efflux system permease component RcnA